MDLHSRPAEALDAVGKDFLTLRYAILALAFS